MKTLTEIKNNDTIISSYTLCDNYKLKNYINEEITHILNNYLYAQKCIELLKKVCCDIRIVYDTIRIVIHIYGYHLYINKTSYHENKIYELNNGRSYNTFEEFSNFVYSNLVQQNGNIVTLRFVE